MVVHGKVAEPHQLLGVLSLGFRLFEKRAGDEVIDRRNPAGDRMAPRCALNWGEPRKRQRIRDRVHAKIGVEKHVEIQGGDRLARGLKNKRKGHVPVGGLTDRDGDIFVAGANR
jgi:hypothetical protein